MRAVITASAILFVAALAGSFLLLQERPSESRALAKDSHNTQRRNRAAGPLRPSVANPRYFTDGTGKSIYLTGSHNWNNLQDADPLFLVNAEGRLVDPGSAPHPKFDFSEHLRFLVRENYNFTRLWTCEEAAWVPWMIGKQTIQPLPYARTGPGNALDGKPKFDLKIFEQEYFDRLRSRVSAAGDNGIYVSVMLFNGWSIETKGCPPMTKVWRGHPFHRANNINGINGDPNNDDEGSEVHTLLIPEVTALQEAYVQKTVTTLNDLDNVLWEISNESAPASKTWQYHMIQFIKHCEAGLPKQHPVGMTFYYPPASNTELLDSPADWISPGQNPGADYCEDPPPGNGRKVIITDTDHLIFQRDRAWVWKSFTRGLNPILMDPVEMASLEPVRKAMGETLAYANRMNLTEMKPHGEFASTGYCLANPGKEYLVYAPLEVPWLESRRFFHRFNRPIRNIRRLFETKVSLDLSSQPGQFRVEWLNPASGDMHSGATVEGGTRISLTAPFKGDAVLYIRKDPLG